MSTFRSGPEKNLPTAGGESGVGRIQKAKHVKMARKKGKNPALGQFKPKALKIPAKHKVKPKISIPEGTLSGRILVRQAKKRKHRGPGKTLRRDLFRRT